MSATYPLQYSCYELLVQISAQAFQASLGVVFCLGCRKQEVSNGELGTVSSLNPPMLESLICAHIYRNRKQMKAEHIQQKRILSWRTLLGPLSQSYSKTLFCTFQYLSSANLPPQVLWSFSWNPQVFRMECIHQEGQRELDTVAVQAAAEEVGLESLFECGFEKFKPVVIQMKYHEVYLEDLVFMDSVAISKCNLKTKSQKRDCQKNHEEGMYTCNFFGGICVAYERLVISLPPWLDLRTLNC